MTKLNIFPQQYTFKIEFHYRYVSRGEQEKDSDSVEITTHSAEDAIEQVMERFNSPSRRIFQVKVVQQIPTLVKSDLFFLTAPLDFNF
jgi:hypothetical protein